MADTANITTTTNTVTVTNPAGTSTTVTAVANETVNVATQSLSAFNTDALTEGSTNLYHTTSRASAAAPVQTITMPNGFTVTNNSGTFAITVGNVANTLASLGANDAANISTGVLAVSRVPTLDASKVGTGTFDIARLPAIQDSYVGHIESPLNKTYHLDPRVAAARTITAVYAVCTSGTCTATFKNGSATIKAVSVSSTESTSTGVALANTSVAENAAITVVVSSNSSCVDLRFVVEYTQ